MALLPPFCAGGVQYALYVPVFGRLFPRAASFAAKPMAEKLADGAGMRAVAAQVILDQCVHHPLLYFPTFDVTREVISKGLSEESVQAALSKYRANMSEDMVALWKVWVPVTCFNFAFSPMWLRIPVVATTSLAWTAILSAMRGASTELEADPSRAMESLGNAGRELARLRHTRPELDSSKTHIVLTAAGHGRSGMLHTLSEARRGGLAAARRVALTHRIARRWCLRAPATSLRAGAPLLQRCLPCASLRLTRPSFSAVQLGSDLTLMMLIEVDPARSAALHSALAEHQRQLRDVHLITRICERVQAPNVPQTAPRAARFQMAAIDRPGLVHIITSALPKRAGDDTRDADFLRLRRHLARAEFLAKHGMDVVEMKCEQREAFVDGKPRRLFFMDGLIAGEAVSAKAFADGLKAMQGAPQLCM